MRMLIATAVIGAIAGVIALICWYGAKITKTPIWWWLIGAVFASPPLWIPGVIIFAIIAAPPIKPAPEMPPDNYTCFGYVRSHYTWKDSGSLRMEGKPTIISNGVLTTITINVNAKNSFGAYGGAKPYSCQFYNGKIQTITE